MKLAIVGSTCLADSKEAEIAIEKILDKYNPNLVISGGAIGIDSMAVASAKNRGIEIKEYLPKTKRWYDGFKPRNLLIAENCDILVRIVSTKSKTYGSGWTRDRAKEFGKEVIEITINE